MRRWASSWLKSRTLSAVSSWALASNCLREITPLNCLREITPSPWSPIMERNCSINCSTDASLSPVRRASAAFALYNYNDDRFVTEDEMVRYLTSVFKVVCHSEPETKEQMGCSVEELVEVTAE